MHQNKSNREGDGEKRTGQIPVARQGWSRLHSESRTPVKHGIFAQFTDSEMQSALHPTRQSPAVIWLEGGFEQCFFRVAGERSGGECEEQ
jgi:hypothetical protein